MKRPLIVIAVAGAAALSLAGCEKPAPGVSVVSGTTSQHREAICWAGDGALSPETCGEDIIQNAMNGQGAASIPVIPGDTIGISVDTAVADAGWFPAIGSQRLTEQPLHTTYYRFTYPDLKAVPAEGISLQVIAGDNTTSKGLWVFHLGPAGA